MISINTNLSSLIAQSSMKKATFSLNQAVERMTTGFKINHAKDNAANYSITTNMTTKINSYMIAQDNVAMGLDMLTTAEENLNLISDKLTRLRDLATQASNGTYGESSLNAINAEANALVDEIERLYSTTEYNGIKLFDQEPIIENEPAGIPKAQYNGFIKEVVKRDTSAMTTLASVDANTALADGTYSISTPEELKKLADMTNAGLVSAGDEFVLANDIDLSQYENFTPIGEYDSVNLTYNYFRGSFDGNGYKILNLTFKTSSYNIALFPYVVRNTIKNLGIEGANISSTGAQVSGIVGTIDRGTIENCYVKESTIVCNGDGAPESDKDASGICGNAHNSTIDSCYSSADILAGKVSGIAIFCNTSGVNIKNCYTDSNLVGLIDSAGILACSKSENVNIENCAVLGNSNLTAVFAGKFGGSTGFVNVKDSYYSSNYLDKGIDLIGKMNAQDVIENVSTLSQQTYSYKLMLGINGAEYNTIDTKSSFYINELSACRYIGFNTWNKSEIDIIDEILSIVNSKSTKFGAVQNRLESALDEIETQYNNLVSSRSTLRDADIAEESSAYIRQQILQEASATLLATANQSPSIALQLI